MTWSSTRPSLQIQAEVVRDNTDSASDPLLVGDAAALSPEECQDLEKKLKG